MVERISVLLDAGEVLWVGEGLPERLAVLDVAGVVGDTGVKDVVEGVFAEEEVADGAQTLPVHFVGPQLAQVTDGVDALLFFPHHFDKAAESKALLPQQPTNLLFIALDEAYDPFPEILRNVLGLVLSPPLTPSRLLLRRKRHWREGVRNRRGL